jgi:hypothetical protein
MMDWLGELTDKLTEIGLVECASRQTDGRWAICMLADKQTGGRLDRYASRITVEKDGLFWVSYSGLTRT